MTHLLSSILAQHLSLLVVYAWKPYGKRLGTVVGARGDELRVFTGEDSPDIFIDLHDVFTR